MSRLLVALRSCCGYHYSDYWRRCCFELIKWRVRADLERLRRTGVQKQKSVGSVTVVATQANLSRFPKNDIAPEMDVAFAAVKNEYVVMPACQTFSAFARAAYPNNHGSDWSRIKASMRLRTPSFPSMAEM